VKQFGGPLTLLEQPLPRNDLEGLAAIRRDTGVPIAADESVRSLADAHEVVAKHAADFVNIKIMKTGLFEARDIAAYALASGLRLMAGGMVETRVAMGCSFSLVLGIKGFEILDLDTPLLLADDPVRGGYRYEEARLIPWDAPGLGLSVQPGSSATVIEPGSIYLFANSGAMVDLGFTTVFSMPPFGPPFVSNRMIPSSLQPSPPNAKPEPVPP
jgi:L-alanine-DL-glutamate epimerase-like enolase superfamily enzyme